MPELPEVETVRKTLKKLVLNKTNRKYYRLLAKNHQESFRGGTIY